MHDDRAPPAPPSPTRAGAVAFLRQLSADLGGPSPGMLRRDLPRFFEREGLYLPSHLRPDYPEPLRLDALQNELSTWAACLEAGCDAEHLRLAREAAGLGQRRAAQALRAHEYEAQGGARGRSLVEGIEEANEGHRRQHARLRVLERCKAPEPSDPSAPFPLATADELGVLAELYQARPEYLIAYPLVLSPPLQAVLAKQKAKGLLPADVPRTERLLLMVGGVPASTLRPSPAPKPSPCNCQRAS